MNAILIEQVGWVLVLSLWQFTVLGLLAAGALRLMQHSSSSARHGMLVVFLGATTLAPPATWLLQPARSPRSEDASVLGVVVADDVPRSDRAAAAEESPATAAPPASPAVPVSTPVEETAETPTSVWRSAADSSLGVRIQLALEPWLPWFVGCWCLGVLVCSLRPIVGWRTLQHLRTVGTSVPSADVLAALERVTQRLGMRQAVQVACSTWATTPLVVGYFRPMVLLPVSLVSSMPVSQLEALLAHELAHIRRHDFLINLLQTLVETLFFYHPAVWWLSRRIRIEREHCCDDLVVERFNNRAVYGRALLAVEQAPGPTTSLALGAKDGSMLARIQRIAGVTTVRERTTLDRWLAAVLSLISIGMMAAVLFISWRDSAQKSPAAPPPAATPPAIAAPAAATEPAVAPSGAKPGEAVTVQPIEPTAGEPAFTLPDHRYVKAIGFTPDGRSLVTVASEYGAKEGVDISIRTWDVAERKLKSEVRLDSKGDWSKFRDAEFLLSDDRTKLIATFNGEAGIWDAVTGKLETRLEIPAELRDGRLTKLTCTPGLSRVACGRVRNVISGLLWDSHAIVWDGTTGDVVRTFTFENAMEIHGLGLSPDGKRLASIGMQRGASMWDVDSGKLLWEFHNNNADRKHPDSEVKPGSTMIVWGGGLSPDGEVLAIADMLGGKLLDAKSGEIVQRLDAPYHYGRPSFVFSPNGSLLAMLGTSMKLKGEDILPIWSTNMGQLIMAVSADANVAAFSPDGKWLAVGLSDPKAAIAVWRVEP